MEARYYFYITYFIWLLDFLTTFIAINFYGLSEGNPLTNFFISFGLIGWFLWLGVAFFGYYLFYFKFVVKIAELMKEPNINRLFFVTTSVFVSLEMFTIINNIKNIMMVI